MLSGTACSSGRDELWRLHRPTLTFSMREQERAGTGARKSISVNIRAAFLLPVRFSADVVGLLAVFGSCARLLIGTQRPCPIQLSEKKKNAEDAVEKGPGGGGGKKKKKIR